MNGDNNGQLVTCQHPREISGDYPKEVIMNLLNRSGRKRMSEPIESPRYLILKQSPIVVAGVMTTCGRRQRMLQNEVLIRMAALKFRSM